MTSGIVLGICLCFHDHAPKQAAIGLAFHQPAANQLRGNDLRWTAEEGVGQGREERGDELGGYGSGFSDAIGPSSVPIHHLDEQPYSPFLYP